METFFSHPITFPNRDNEKQKQKLKYKNSNTKRQNNKETHAFLIPNDPSSLSK